ncbi:MAG TPA: uroporphyrinogen decarboxylase family protein [Armatimonadota bacterium]|jgi:uroporphyrinogen decarboxylase
MTKRENYLRCARFQGPDWIPCSIGALPAGWKALRGDLLKIALQYPDFFGELNPEGWDYDEMPWRNAAGVDYTDNWGVVWRTELDGVVGIPQVHPLADLSKVDEYQVPDIYTRDPSYGDRDLEKDEIQRIERQLEAGELAGSGFGTFFERLQELVGMENLFLNMAYDDNPALQRVVDLVADFNYSLTQAVLTRVTPDIIGAGDDLGSQRAALVSPKTFRRWLKPGYARCFGAARAAGCETSMHSDGYLLELVDDLIDAGLTILNPQVGPNTLAGIEEVMKGRLAISLDLDRQHILPNGTPQEVRDHVREAVQVLGSPRGGLMLQAELNADVPLENVIALAEAMREYQTYYKTIATPL